MFEFHADQPLPGIIRAFAKNFFDFLRSMLVVATLGFFWKKSNSTLMFVVFIASANILGLYLGSFIATFNFKKSFFANNRQAQVFSACLSLFMWLLIYIPAIAIINLLITEAMIIQLK